MTRKQIDRMRKETLEDWDWSVEAQAGQYVRDEGKLMCAVALVQAMSIRRAAAPEISVSEAARVLLKDTTIAEKKAMNEAGASAMTGHNLDTVDQISFDVGRIAALKALQDGE